MGTILAGHWYTRPLAIGSVAGIAALLLALAVLHSSPGTAGAQVGPGDVVIESDTQTYDSIQDAIDAAEDGDTILVGPGTYADEVDCGGRSTVVCFDGDPNLTLRSTHGPDVTIIDTEDHYFGIGVLDNVGTVTVEGFTVTSGWRAGGIVQGMSARDGTTVHVVNNIVEAPDETGTHGNSIQVTGDGSTVRDNVVAATHQTHEDWGATGILVWGAAGVEVTGNTVSGSDSCVAIGGGRYDQPPSADTVVADNHLSGCEKGVLVQAAVLDTEITGNVISGHAYGIAEDALIADGDNFAPSGTVARSNALTNNDVAVGMLAREGAEYDEGHELDAIRNYWGTTNASAIAALTEGDVVFDPWCTDAACTTFSDDPPPQPTPPPLPPQPDPTPAPEPGEVEPELENEQSEPVDTEAGATVQTTSANGSTASVSIPANALPADAPEGTSVQVAAVSNPDQVREQAPPPSTADVVTEFVVTLLDPDGNPVSATFEGPVTLGFTLPAETVPEGASAETLVLAYWNGEQWIEVEATVTVEAGGSYSLSAEVMHFTLFSVFVAPPEWGTFVPEPDPGVTVTVWQGGGYTRLAHAVGGGNSVWTTVDGEFIGYVVGAPEFVNADFVAHYPEGVPTGGTVLVAQ